MSSRRKILFGVLGFYALSLIAIFLIFGFTRRDNEEFQPQNEFKLDTWVNLPGPFDINKAVMYLVIAGILTCVTMIWIARRMQARPNRVQTAVEVMFSLMRDNITRGNLDDRMARKYFPFIGALFLFIWFSNLIGYIPLPTNTHEKFDFFGVQVPAFATVCRPSASRFLPALWVWPFTTLSAKCLSAKSWPSVSREVSSACVHWRSELGWSTRTASASRCRWARTIPLAGGGPRSQGLAPSSSHWRSRSTSC